MRLNVRLKVDSELVPQVAADGGDLSLDRRKAAALRAALASASDIASADGPPGGQSAPPAPSAICRCAPASSLQRPVVRPAARAAAPARGRPSGSRNPASQPVSSARRGRDVAAHDLDEDELAEARGECTRCRDCGPAPRPGSDRPVDPAGRSDAPAGRGMCSRRGSIPSSGLNGRTSHPRKPHTNCARSGPPPPSSMTNGSLPGGHRAEEIPAPHPASISRRPAPDCSAWRKDRRAETRRYHRRRTGPARCWECSRNRLPSGRCDTRPHAARLAG